MNNVLKNSVSIFTGSDQDLEEGADDDDDEPEFENFSEDGDESEEEMELETEDFDDNFDEDEFENSKLENSKGKKNKKNASFDDDEMEEDFNDDFAAEFDEPSPNKKAKKSKSAGKRDPNDLMSLLASADEFSALVRNISRSIFLNIRIFREINSQY